MKTVTNKACPNIENRKVRYNYFILDTLECGLSLKGHEVKSVREGQCNINQAWCTIQNGELVLRGMHIAKWFGSNAYDTKDGEERERILLAHKSEIRKIGDRLKLEDGITLIPLRIYFSNGKCKVELGVCKGKRDYDKRETIKKRDVERETQREF